MICQCLSPYHLKNAGLHFKVHMPDAIPFLAQFRFQGWTRARNFGPGTALNQQSMTQSKVALSESKQVSPNNENKHSQTRPSCTSLI